jgi:trans-2,3-dihydro-3-hydroxyanthranilate isomerase
VTIVNACLRDGHGGSPTAVLDESENESGNESGGRRWSGLPDAERRRLPVHFGTSHVVFVDGSRLRFFTAAGELPACGHGTVAALALLARRAGTPDTEITLTVGDRSFRGHTVREGDHIRATFDPGPVTVRPATAGEAVAVAAALTSGETVDEGNAHVATLGRPRLLLPVADRAAVAALTPDLADLRVACDRLGLLGCYVYSPPDDDGRVAARMFAPSIGVPEDIANANSTACLSAALGRPILADMGDALGHAATVAAGPAADGRLLVGGVAMVTMVG